MKQKQATATQHSQPALLGIKSQVRYLQTTVYMRTPNTGAVNPRKCVICGNKCSIKIICRQQIRRQLKRAGIKIICRQQIRRQLKRAGIALNDKNYVAGKIFFIATRKKSSCYKPETRCFRARILAFNDLMAKTAIVPKGY